ncbi:hypothetical protein ACS0TY_002002 [Phlomoides rotata]
MFDILYRLHGQVIIVLDKLGLRLELGSFAAGVMIATTDLAQHTLYLSHAEVCVLVQYKLYNRLIPEIPEKILKLREQLIPGKTVKNLALEVLDKYGNHAKEDEIISLRVVGFSFQDGSGIVGSAATSCMKNVDAEGFVDLGNALKVFKGYGKDVCLSVISKERVIFRDIPIGRFRSIVLMFDILYCRHGQVIIETDVTGFLNLFKLQCILTQLPVFDKYGNHAKEEIISLRVVGFSFQDGSGIVGSAATGWMKNVDAEEFVDLGNALKVSKGYGKDVINVFKKNCEAGSQLENIVFEMTDSQGKIDESIHDEDKHGKPHTLTIKSDSFEIDDIVGYSFRYGRCTVRSIHLPRKEGTFSCTFSLSRVHVKNARKEKHKSIRNDDGGMVNFIFSDHRLCENDQVLGHSASFSQETRRVLSPQSYKKQVSHESRRAFSQRNSKKQVHFQNAWEENLEAQGISYFQTTDRVKTIRFYNTLSFLEGFSKKNGFTWRMLWKIIIEAHGMMRIRGMSYFQATDCVKTIRFSDTLLR